MCLVQGSYSEKPRVLEHASYTKAAPFKEKKHFRHVSDSIANNYSPTASHLNTAYIYQMTKFGNFFYSVFIYKEEKVVS